MTTDQEVAELKEALREAGVSPELAARCINIRIRYSEWRSGECSRDQFVAYCRAALVANPALAG